MQNHASEWVFANKNSCSKSILSLCPELQAFCPASRVISYQNHFATSLSLFERKHSSSSRQFAQKIITCRICLHGSFKDSQRRRCELVSMEIENISPRPIYSTGSMIQLDKFTRDWIEFRTTYQSKWSDQTRLDVWLLHLDAAGPGITVMVDWR